MGKAAVVGFYRGLWQVLSDSNIEVHDLVEQQDRLACRATMSAVHRGELAGVAPTGRRIHQPVMTILRFADDRCVERWSIADFPAVMAQITAA
jgi:predicted ester cyclase